MKVPSACQYRVGYLLPMRLVLVMVRTLINFLLPALRHESLTPAHTAEAAGVQLDRVEISCTKRGQLQVVLCGAGAARAGIIVRGKPDKLDLSRGLICLDTSKIYKYTR